MKWLLTFQFLRHFIRFAGRYVDEGFDVAAG